MSREIEKFTCPLTSEEITEHNCYEICLVAEEVIKKSFISERFTRQKDFKETCLNCPHHDME